MIMFHNLLSELWFIEIQKNSNWLKSRDNYKAVISKLSKISSSNGETDGTFREINFDQMFILSHENTCLV